jgi:CheY-like chemotaxis protein
MQHLKELFIIIVDDDEDDIELLREVFQNHPAYNKIVCCSNGVELMAAITDEEMRPDVILTDINMPVMGGLEALDNLQLYKIPTIVFSTIANPVLETRYLELGIIGFLKKPINFKGYTELPRKVNDILLKINKQ